ncbi:hypothetical protein BJ741DRAFT_419751 [Chytriomyces cf. hyalinus JEL632]|nr:hypothetical protein BJ741DRAFT_419751 [Chytriomyces cf. hyalinus JEL632]
MLTNQLDAVVALELGDGCRLLNCFWMRIWFRADFRYIAFIGFRKVKFRHVRFLGSQHNGGPLVRFTTEFGLDGNSQEQRRGFGASRFEARRDSDGAWGKLQVFLFGTPNARDEHSKTATTQTTLSTINGCFNKIQIELVLAPVPHSKTNNKQRIKNNQQTTRKDTHSINSMVIRTTGPMFASTSRNTS